VTILGSVAGVKSVKFGLKEVAATVDPNPKPGKLSVTTPPREDAGNSDDVEVTLIFASESPHNSFVVGKYHYDPAAAGDNGKGVTGNGGGQVVTATSGGIDRRQFAPELGNLTLVRKAADMVKGEVGWNAPHDTKLVQLETVFNRAMARRQSLAQCLWSTSEAGQLGYYQGGSNGTYSRPVTDTEFADFKQNILREVYIGSNRSQELLGFIANGNASPPTSTTQIDQGMRHGDLASEERGHPETYFEEGPFPWKFPSNNWPRFQGGESLSIPWESSSPIGPAADPLWLVKARSFKGFTWADGTTAPPQIDTWLNLIKTNSPNNPDLAQYCDRLAAEGARGEVPWCGIFVASMLAEAGLPPVFGPTDNDRFALATAWDVYGTKVDIENGAEPQPGDIMRFTWPGSPPGHHVTFYNNRVETDNQYHCCGGNQGRGQEVSIDPMAMTAIRAVRRPPAAAAAPPAAAAAAPAAAGAASTG
jgi:hypothetical protein